MSVPSRVIRPVSCVVLLAVASGHLMAQEEPARQQDPMFPTVTVEFRGGTLSGFVAAVQGAGKDINILLPAEADNVRVPALTLKRVGVESALAAVADIIDDRYQVHVKTHRGSGQPVHAVRVQERRKGSRGTSTTVAGNTRPVSGVRVFSLNPLTKTQPTDPAGSKIAMSPETVITAIDTGLAVSAQQGQAKPDIRHHQESGLLFVRGTIEQTVLVQNVIERLTRDIDKARHEALMKENSNRRQQNQQKSVKSKEESGSAVKRSASK